MSLIIIIAIILFFIFVCGVSYRLEVSQYDIEDEKINDDITITVISDLHCSKYGEHNEDLAKKIADTKPDLIFLPGDLYDDRYPTINTDDLITRLPKIKRFMVIGNHECGNGKFTEEIEFIKEHGIHVLRNASEVITIKNTQLTIIGCDDFNTDKAGWPIQLDKAFEEVNDDHYHILLCHRPSYIEDFKKTDADLIVAGHAHGGQWCIPFTKKGVLAPQQSFFPKYTSGVHEFDGKRLVISRGLSKHPYFVPRLYNRPEIVVIKLKRKPRN